jgi:hypothetical protein
MITAKTINLDVTKKYSETITVQQYETDGRDFDIRLSAGILPVDVTGASVTLYATKPDETTDYEACTVVDGPTGKVLFTMPSSMCAVDGTLACVVIISKDGETLRSPLFSITVDESPDVSGAAASTSQWTALEDALATIAGYDARMTAAEGNITSLGTRMGTAESNITSLGTRMGTAESNITSLGTRMGTAESNISDLKTEWIPLGATATYLSATTFRVSGDYTGVLQAKDWIRLVQSSTTKYFAVVSVAYSSPYTTVTVVGVVSDTLENATITSPYYSKALPQSLPSSRTLLWSGSWAGSPTTISVPGLSNYRYFEVSFGEVRAIGIRSNTFFFAGFPFMSSAVQEALSFYCTYSGDVLTWGAALRLTHPVGASHGSGTSQTLQGIYGIL